MQPANGPNFSIPWPNIHITSFFDSISSAFQPTQLLQHRRQEININITYLMSYMFRINKDTIKEFELEIEIEARNR